MKLFKIMFTVFNVIDFFLQEAIDQIVRDLNFKLDIPNASRAFARPSGTENIVRIYAESITQELANWLANEVVILTYELASGRGPKPGHFEMPSIP